MELESRGIATVTVGSHLFVRLAETERRALGMPDLPMAIVPHPIGGMKSKDVQAKADGVLDVVVAALTARS